MDKPSFVDQLPANTCPANAADAAETRLKVQTAYCIEYANSIGLEPRFGELAGRTWPIAPGLTHPGFLMPSEQHDLVGWIHTMVDLHHMIGKLGELGSEGLALQEERKLLCPEHASELEQAEAAVFSHFMSLETALFRAIAKVRYLKA
jgi:hypothetical protein